MQKPRILKVGKEKEDSRHVRMTFPKVCGTCEYFVYRADKNAIGCRHKEELTYNLETNQDNTRTISKVLSFFTVCNRYELSRNRPNVTAFYDIPNFGEAYNSLTSLINNLE